ncbi:MULTISPECIES: hypothetical protein [Listeria]|uniref:hypothetical protein n=1 Tax=Listeria TaxID=1637 RepID=UPI000B5973D2|nr:MULTISPECIES: hypothetical protein [Listeria]
MINNRVFALNQDLEKNVKQIVKEIALKNQLHLNSKYAKDCAIEVIAEGNFDGMPNVELKIEREDKKNVKSHSFFLTYIYDEKGNEGALLESKFYGSKDHNKVMRNIPFSQDVEELAHYLNTVDNAKFNRESQKDFFYNQNNYQVKEESEVF